MTAEKMLIHPGVRENVSPLKVPKDNDSLIVGLMSGDPAAADLFCDRFGPRVNRWVWRLLGADREHDEIVQQVYVGILSALKRLKDASALDAFVDSVAIRTVRKEIRRRCYRRRIFGRADERTVDEVKDRAHPLQAAHIRVFYTILDTLAPDERVVFVMHHLEGLSMAAIAQVCGYSTATAKRRLRKGTAAFRDRVEKAPVLLTLLEELCHEA